DLAEHVERSAARHAVHGRDHGLPEIVRLRADVLSGIVEVPRAVSSGFAVRSHRVVPDVVSAVPAAHHLFAIDADTECLLAGTGEHRTPHLAVAPHGTPDVLQLALHL